MASARPEVGVLTLALRVFLLSEAEHMWKCNLCSGPQPDRVDSSGGNCDFQDETRACRLCCVCDEKQAIHAVLNCSLLKPGLSWPASAPV